MTYYVGLLPFDSDLSHHGIKNQKWGRRRYQNKDGSLTTLGYEHYYGENGISKDNSKKKTEVLTSVYDEQESSAMKSHNRKSSRKVRTASYNDEAQISSNKKKAYKKKKTLEKDSEYSTATENDAVGEIMIYGTEDEYGRKVPARVTVQTANGIVEGYGKVPLSEVMKSNGSKNKSAYKDLVEKYGDVLLADISLDDSKSSNKTNKNERKVKKKKSKKNKTITKATTFDGGEAKLIKKGNDRRSYYGE